MMMNSDKSTTNGCVSEALFIYSHFSFIIRKSTMRFYLCPALMDWLLMLVIFAVCYGAGARHAPQQAPWLNGVFNATYMLGSLAAGRLLTRRNALSILIVGIALGALAGAFSLFSTRFGLLLAAMGLMGIGASLVFNAFQAFMRGESAPGGLTRAAAFYAFAWSGGVSLGLLSSSLLYELGPIPLGGLVVLVSAAMVGVLLLHRQRPHDQPSVEEHTEQGPPGSAPVSPQYLWIAWIMIFTAMFVQRPIMTLFPAVSAGQGVRAALAGLPLFLHFFVQAVGGLFMGRLRRWLYRPGPLMAIQLGAVAAFLLLCLFPNYALVTVVIAALGMWAGFTYFCVVYYACNYGNRARNIGINEFLVGLGSLVSPFVCQAVMRRSGSMSAMWAVCAAALALSCAAQWMVLKRRSSVRSPTKTAER
jgi:MFS family permease